MEALPDVNVTILDGDCSNGAADRPDQLDVLPLGEGRRGGYGGQETDCQCDDAQGHRNPIYETTILGDACPDLAHGSGESQGMNQKLLKNPTE